VLITEWDQLEIQGYAPLQVLQDQGWASFHEHDLHFVLLCSKLSVEVSEKTVTQKLYHVLEESVRKIVFHK
jgi:hypothetical protein